MTKILFMGGPKHGEWMEAPETGYDQTILVPHLDKPTFIHFHEEQQHTLGTSWDQHSYTKFTDIECQIPFLLYEYEGLGDENVRRRAELLDLQIKYGYNKNREINKLREQRDEIAYEWGI